MLDARLRAVREEFFKQIPRTEAILYYNSKDGRRTRRRHTKHDKERCRLRCRLAKNDRRGMSMKIEAVGADISTAYIGELLRELTGRHRGLLFYSSSRSGRHRQTLEPCPPYKFFIRVATHDRRDHQAGGRCGLRCSELKQIAATCRS